MHDTELITLWLAIWLGGLALLLVSQRSSRFIGVGLALAYLIRLGITHIPGGAIQILPWYELPNLDTVEKGLGLSAFGVVSFVSGVILLAPLVWRLLGGHVPSVTTFADKATAVPARLPLLYVVLGVLSITVLVPLFFRVPTLNAISSSLTLFLSAGCCLGYWNAFRRGNRLAMFRWLAIACCVPLITITVQGYLGYGTTAMLIVLCFVYAVGKPGWRALLLSTLVVFIGLSVYVTYMRDREDIRDVVWNNAAYSERLETTAAAFTDFEWFNPYNQHHLRMIDDRLNQNFLVGLSVDYLQAGNAEFVGGRTIQEAFLSLVPRALWPEKPIVAGSGELFTEFTGVPVAEGTSVGIGQIMEFYINFGATGVVFGLLLFGLAIGLLDRAAAAALARDDWQRFTVFFLIGVACIQPEGSLVDIFASAGAVFIGALLVTTLAAQFFGPRADGPIEVLPTPSPAGRR